LASRDAREVSNDGKDKKAISERLQARWAPPGKIVGTFVARAMTREMAAGYRNRSTIEAVADAVYGFDD